MEEVSSPFTAADEQVIEFDCKVPGSRFNIDDYWSNTGEQNKMMARKGHFLTEGTLFDESFFNLSPREALNTDVRTFYIFVSPYIEFLKMF